MSLFPYGQEPAPTTPTEITTTIPPDSTEAGDQPKSEELAADDPSQAADPTGWRLVALIPHDGQEPPPGMDDDAQAAWCAVSSLWHPSLIARARELPRIESVSSPSVPGEREVRVVAGDSASSAFERLPAGYLAEAEQAGTLLIESGLDREALVRRIQEHLGAVGTPETSSDEAAISAALDFEALGTARWFLRDLTIAMGHTDNLDVESLTREAIAGAAAWQIGDRPTALNRLRAAFEILTQARERFYPVDAYFLDLCLLDPGLPAGSLAEPLDARSPVTFLAPASAIESQDRLDPDRVTRLREAIGEGWADVAGGAYTETEESLLPLESIVWQLRRGGEVYRRHLDDRNVETLARRRFGLYPQLPQLGRRFGFRFAVHLGFDSGRFPVRQESKRLWESPDGSNLESLLRPPLAGDRPSQGRLLPWRLGASMKNDHVATLPIVRWPGKLAPWFVDLRRVASYSPVLARWVTLNDYFHITDRPYETFRPEGDAYVSPFLSQAVARRDPTPIARLARHHRLRARFEGVRAIRGLAAATAGTGLLPDPDSSELALPDLGAVETDIEQGRQGDAEAAIQGLERAWGGALARQILGEKPAENALTTDRPGYLVLNSLGIARRATVVLPDAAMDLQAEGPLRAAQFTEDGVVAVVDLPPFGFAWVPAQSNLDRPPAPPSTTLSAQGRILRNESVEVEIDPATGGIRGVRAVGESTSRLGQQLVAAGCLGVDGTAATSRMQAEGFEIEYGGPALVQATSRGVLLDSGRDRRIASFSQRYRLWAGRPILEIDVHLSDLDPDWFAEMGQADPWSRYLACRWAWPDSTSMLRRLAFGAPELTQAERPETPEAIDISTRRQRTGILFGGLPYHQKHGSRMLDTLLIAGEEQTRRFQLGVVLDLEFPFQAAQDFITPAVVVPVQGGPPRGGTMGWLARIDQKSVAISHVEFSDGSDNARGWGVTVLLVETAGHASRCRLRFCRDPVWARQIDFHGETTIDLPLEGDAVLVDLTPHEMARVEVTLG
jgi:alpha-mannosidase